MGLILLTNFVYWQELPREKDSDIIAGLGGRVSRSIGHVWHGYRNSQYTCHVLAILNFLCIIYTLWLIQTWFLCHPTNVWYLDTESFSFHWNVINSAHIGFNFHLVLVFLLHERKQVEGSNSTCSRDLFTSAASYGTVSTVLENGHCFSVSPPMKTKPLKGK